MKDKTNPFEEEHWKKTGTRIFTGFVLLTVAGLACFPFDPLIGFLVWFGSLGGGIVFAILLNQAAQTAFRCRECGTTFLPPLLPGMALHKRTDESFVHCPVCHEKRWASRFIVVYS